MKDILRNPNTLRAGFATAVATVAFSGCGAEVPQKYETHEMQSGETVTGFLHDLCPDASNGELQRGQYIIGRVNETSTPEEPTFVAGAKMKYPVNICDQIED